MRSESIAHAVTYPLHIDEDFEGEESPNVLILGPDPAGNILEVIGAFDNAEVFSVFHAMPARTGYLRMLERRDER